MKNIFIFTYILILLSTFAFSSENIALEKKVFFSPTPNYRHTTDSDDAIQLTDGKFTSSKSGTYWTQKSTVGWRLSTPRITIDLEKIEPIERIVVHSIGGGVSGVFAPQEIELYVSDDNITFHQVQVLSSDNLRQNEKDVFTHAFTAENLKTRGRYLMVVLKPRGHYTFSDEIEVFRGDFDPSSVAFSTPPISGAEILYAPLGLTPESYTRGHFPETPHVKWAIPLSGKPPKAILMSDFRYMRDVVEVAQRLGVDYTPIPFEEKLPDIISKALEENLNDCEVLVVGTIKWSALSPTLLEKIKNRIRDGMGLVCLDTTPQKPIADLFKENPIKENQHILDFIPIMLIPGYHLSGQQQYFQLAMHGEGRVALLNSGKFTRSARFFLPAFTEDDYIEEVNGPLEYWFAALNKLILWTLNRNEHAITTLMASPDKINLQIKPDSKIAKLRATIRDPYFNIEKTWEAPVSATETQVEYIPPIGVLGIHTIDIWLLDEQGGIVDFGSAFYKITGESRIASIKVGKLLFSQNESITANIGIKNPVKGLIVRATLFDTLNREVSKPQLIPAETNDNVSIYLPYLNPLTLSATLQVELLKGSEVIELKRERIWVEVQDSHDFTVIGWTVKDEEQPVAAANLKILRENGIDGYAGLYKPNRPRNAALANLRYSVENIARIAPPVPANPDGIRPLCLSDPAFQKSVESKLKSVAVSTRRYGVTEWSLGDEEKLGKYGEEYCQSSYCLSAFRDWLQIQYKDLQELNQSWHSSFKDWQEIVPSSLEAVKSGDSIAAWLDHRVFMETVFADYHARASQVIKAENPTARVGFSGSQNPDSYNGYDWWKLMQAIDHVSGYVGIQSSLQRSFMKPGTFFTTFIGYDYNDTDEQKAHGQPWKVLFNGANGINYFSLTAGSLPCGILRTDFSPTKKAAWIFPEIQELKSGIGRLFMEGHYEDDGIGILYSPASIHSATAANLAGTSDKRRRFGVNLANLGKLLSESHYQYRFVHEEQLKQGELSKLKVLFLAWNSALSQAEADAIRQFVREGGTVIADSFVGIRNNHGVATPMLEDVFGIQQSLKVPPLRDGELEVNDASFAVLGKIMLAAGNTDIQSKGAQARGTVNGYPAFFMNSYGKGHAIFLNASFSNYSEEDSGGVGGEVTEGKDAEETITGPIRQFVTAILTEAGVPIPMPLQSEGIENSDIELTRFQLGDAQLLGVMRAIKGGAVNLEDRSDFTITLNKPSHIYEMRSGQYLGVSQVINERLPRAIAKAYALLPYKVDTIHISGNDDTMLGSPAKLKIKVVVSNEGDKVQSGTHVFHLTVQMPDGETCQPYVQNLIAKNGEAEALIPFAWNDPEGEWSISVKDVATGTENKWRIHVGK